MQAMRSGGHKGRHHFTKPPKKRTYISCHVSPFTATLKPQTPGDPLVRFHTILAGGTSGNGHTRTHGTPPSTHGVTPACANREVLWYAFPSHHYTLHRSIVWGVGLQDSPERTNGIHTEAQDPARHKFPVRALREDRKDVGSPVKVPSPVKSPHCPCSWRHLHQGLTRWVYIDPLCALEQDEEVRVKKFYEKKIRND